MPIKPENKGRYPKDWPEIRARILKRADHKCEFCGVPDGAWGHRRDGRFISCPRHACLCEDVPRLRIVLTVAHLDHTPENCSGDNLKALCQKCHLTYDAKHHAASARETRIKKQGLQNLFE